MRKLISAAWLLTAAPLALATGPAMAADQPIAGFEAAQQAAWNAHDPAAYTAAFDQNADIITAAGWHWTGQAEAARSLGDGFKLVYARASMQVTDVHIRTLTPDQALVTLTWTMAGARTMDGAVQAGEQHGFETQLLQQRGAGWVILFQQDTAAGAVALSPTPSAATSAPAVAAEPTTAPATFPMTPPPVRRCIVGRANGECLIYGKPKPAPK